MVEYKNLLTNPREHDPNNFIYLVRGVYFDAEWSKKDDIKDIVNMIKNPNMFYRASIVGCLDREAMYQRFGCPNRKVHQVSTYNQLGLILNPASDDVVLIAWNCDLHSPSKSESIKEFIKKYEGKRKDLLTLLTQSKSPYGYGHNELILGGNEETEIVGIFYTFLGIDYFDLRTEQNKDALMSAISNFMKSDIPLVHIPSREKREFTLKEQTRNREEAEQTRSEFYSGLEERVISSISK